ncbi:MAG TPA: ABC transporter substrate-binding protein, partial [Anaerolineales bacterium]
LDADALYYPVYTVDGVNITQEAAKRQLRSALISSDGLLSSDFIEKAGEASQGMYLSGPAPVPESSPFVEQYRNLYGEDPVASYHLQAYDAAEILFGAIEKAARSSRDGSLLIGKQALRDAILGVHGMTGLSGPLTCSELGDCAQPNIEIFQVQKNEFQAIYP